MRPLSLNPRATKIKKKKKKKTWRNNKKIPLLSEHRIPEESNLRQV
jgi:hypothetical protein